MSQNTNTLIKAAAVPEGGGVTVHRTIGTPSLKSLDPFLMLDFFGSDNPDEYIAGFPEHPHRGFNTFTYLLDGYSEHRDSMGNQGVLGPGGAQWMKAASGVIHSEMPQQENGLLRGIQLWINLPAAEKMTPPEYQEYPADAFATVEGDGYRVKLLVGAYGSAVAPIEDEITDVHYLDIKIEPGRPFSHNVPQDHNGFLYLFEGGAKLEQSRIAQHTLVTLYQNQPLELVAGEQGARMILCSGRPIGEPIVQAGPFVMNSEAEIRQAMQDYQQGHLVQ